MKLKRNPLGILICLFFFILVSGCLQKNISEKPVVTEETPAKVDINEIKVPKISKEDAVKIALNDSRVIAKIGNHTFETEEAVSAVLNEEEVYLVNVQLYNSKLIGTINVFVTYEGQVEVIGWEYPSFIPTPPNNDK